METQDSKGAARAAWGIYIMRRIMCALGRTFFSSHEKSGRWFAMEAKEKELRRSRPRWSRLYVKKFRETDRGRVPKGKGTWMHRDARNSALRREVTPRWETRLYTYFPRWIAMDHLLRVDILGLFAEIIIKKISRNIRATRYNLCTFNQHREHTQLILYNKVIWINLDNWLSRCKLIITTF